MTVKELKVGDYFTVKDIVNPKDSQVFIRGEYDRASKAYECIRFSDISDSKLFKGSKEVFVDFEF